MYQYRNYQDYDTLMELYARDNPFYHIHYKLMSNNSKYVLLSETCDGCICCSPYDVQEFKANSYEELIKKLPDTYKKKMKQNYIDFSRIKDSEKKSYGENIMKSVLNLGENVVFCKKCRNEFNDGIITPHNCVPYVKKCNVKGCRDLILKGDYINHIHRCDICYVYTSIKQHDFETHLAQCYEVRCNDCYEICYWISRKNHKCVINPEYGMESVNKFTKVN